MIGERKQKKTILEIIIGHDILLGTSFALIP